MKALLALAAPYALPIALAGAGLAFVGGYKIRDWQCDAAAARELEANAIESARMQDAADTAATGYEQDRSQTYADHTVREETIRTIYRDRQVPGDCAVPDNAALVLDEAVRAANTGTTGEPRR